jgi:hypothetical protein
VKTSSKRIQALTLPTPTPRKHTFYRSPPCDHIPSDIPAMDGILKGLLLQSRSAPYPRDAARATKISVLNGVKEQWALYPSMHALLADESGTRVIGAKTADEADPPRDVIMPSNQNSALMIFRGITPELNQVACRTRSRARSNLSHVPRVSDPCHPSPFFSPCSV